MIAYVIVKIYIKKVIKYNRDKVDIEHVLDLPDAEKLFYKNKEFPPQYNKYITQQINTLSEINPKIKDKKIAIKIRENDDFKVSRDDINSMLIRKDIPADNSCGFHAFLSLFFRYLKPNGSTVFKVLFSYEYFKYCVNYKIFIYWRNKAIDVVRYNDTYESCTQREQYLLVFYIRLFVSAVLYNKQKKLIPIQKDRLFKNIFKYAVNLDEWMDQQCLGALAKGLNIKINVFDNNSNNPYTTTFDFTKNKAKISLYLILANNHWEPVEMVEDKPEE
ncbi:hypothetical protein ECANGB1_730 [Enterospora canceri]|uniref:OTU domain-containing protein n=1 Tax=Enterospora canceri TaxID=1081671 RepID=A0A1Y1S7J1_9MICR|nr:hypothetical protein ECANGB1_730 [Enterospora canceri]